ncbi:hypothetical protein P154DRAFT_439759 [Amniculicola lignicola CBS 123094]|uniref:Uncharacterized protein n=1 Tax=Amniculicola lignicola CBS 123094 TaxID=1392246 RepID=A0A6A5WBK7_9PLEO|nr:hypothetical protein P154DRAFT_439759 [Amniculicola lignicola CBS 123094]
MAGSDSSTSGASQLPKSEAPAISIKTSKKLPRRKVTLIAISVCLHVLLWSSIFTLVISLYLIATDPEDTTYLPTVVLTIASALVSAAYIVIHTVFSFKQRIWKHQRRHPSINRKTSYIAIRFTVTLIILWLLTSGWNFITIARRPVCLPAQRGLSGWEAGTPCMVGRAGVAISFIALIASCTIFGMLSVVRRPFEAHLFKIGYRQPANPHPTPSVSRIPSLTHSASFTSEKYRNRISASTRRSTLSNHSTTDIDPLDLNHPSTSTILSPSPIRSIGLGIFTSHAQPPPLPTAYIPPRSTSLEPTPPPIFHPTSSVTPLAPPPRIASLITPSGFVPLAVQGQYSASTWRAVHPSLPSPLGPHTSRSYPHLPQALAQGHNFSYRPRYSRSSVSLTRPHRLSTATPSGSVGWSSRSGSTGPDEGRGSSDDEESAKRASASQIAYAILNDTAFPGTTDGREWGKGKGNARHVRHASAPDTSMGRGIIGVGIGVEQNGKERLPKGWKPLLAGEGREEEKRGRGNEDDDGDSYRIRTESSPDRTDPHTALRLSLNLQHRLSLHLQMGGPASAGPPIPIRKSRSESPLRHSDIPGGAAKISENFSGNSSASTTNRLSRLPREPTILKRNSRSFTTGDTQGGGEVGGGTKEGIDRQGKRVRTFEEVKNKPLPRIAAL